MTATPARRWAAVGAVLALSAALTTALAGFDAVSGKAASETRRLAFVKTFDRGFTYNLVISGPFGGNRVRIRKRVIGRPSFSPDGKRVAFSAAVTDGSDGRYGIYVARTGGSGVKRLTAPKYADLDPAWSPNGKKIAFSRDRLGNSRPSSCCQLARMNADGSRVQFMSSTRGGTLPSWAPDSKRVVYRAPGGLRIKRLGESGSRSLRRGSNLTDPAWSPDGKRIAFIAHRGGGRSRLRTIAPGGGSAHTRIDSGRMMETPAWGSNSKTLWFVGYRGPGDEGRTTSAVWRQPASGARQQMLINDKLQVYHLAFTQR
ncbi:MAG: LpqB family beta-propeller domain-containing protein [Egibacteraceae bacterium]